MPKKLLSELTHEEWKALVDSGMAWEFYPDGPPDFGRRYEAKEQADARSEAEDRVSLAELAQARSIPLIATPFGDDSLVKFGEDSE